MEGRLWRLSGSLSFTLNHLPDGENPPVQAEILVLPVVCKLAVMGENGFYRQFRILIALKQAISLAVYNIVIFGICFSVFHHSHGIAIAVIGSVQLVKSFFLRKY